MTEDRYLRKVDLKKMLGIHEAELIDLVEKEILPIYFRHPTGSFVQIPHRVEYREPVTRLNPVTGRYYQTSRSAYRKPTREAIAGWLTCDIGFRQSDIEDARYEGNIPRPEKQHGETSVAEAGRGGGNVPKSNRAISTAIQDFLIDDPAMLNFPDGKIIKRVCKRFTSDKPCTFELDGNACEVYCDGDKIHSSIGDKSKKSIKISTVQRFYLPAAKKAILQKKSNNPS